ncbi:MAG TPA: superoxide dismutase, partial [Hyphomonadaceae bacterium]|nr:superoxide dismutase [Hyphomonadaceae bacterium]
MTVELDRRSAMVAVAAGLALSAVQGTASGQTPTTTLAKGVQPKPLPFDPKTITGFSEKILVSHHDNNYVGAVNRLNQIDAQLAGMDMATAPGFVINGLKREELIATNSMILH